MPGAATDSRPSKDAVTVAQQKAVARGDVPAQPGGVAQPPVPVREYAHRDEAGVPFEGDQRPALLFTATGHRTTMARCGHARSNEMVGASVCLLRRRPRSGGARRHPMLEVHLAVRRRLAVLARLSRGWSVASVRHVMGSATMASSCSSSASSPRSSAVASVVGGLYVARSTAASGFVNAIDSCHAQGLHARLASDETSLTLEAFSDSGDSLTTPIFQCVLGKLGTPAAVRERMYATPRDRWHPVGGVGLLQGDLDIRAGPGLDRHHQLPMTMLSALGRGII